MQLERKVAADVDMGMDKIMDALVTLEAAKRDKCPLEPVGIL